MRALALLLLAGTGALAAPWPQVTYALTRPLEEREEATLTARLPDWEQLGRFDRYAVPVATPTAGGDLLAQVACLERLAAAVGSERLVVVTPTVGTAGWECSQNPAYLPLGGRREVVPTRLDEWLTALAGSRAGTLALLLEGWRRPPTDSELGAQIDALLRLAGAHRQAVELWLPATALAAAPPPDWLKALTGPRLAALSGLVWLDTAAAARQLGTPPPPNPPAKKGTPPAKGGEQTVRPPALDQREGLPRLAARMGALSPLERQAADLSDTPRHPLKSSGEAAEYLDQLLSAGLRRLVVRGRLDTPQVPLWSEILRALKG